MEGIEFDTEKYKPLPSMQDPAKKSWAIRIVMKLSGGRIKTDEQASYVLVAIAVIFIIVSIYNFSSAGGGKKLSEEEIQKIQNTMDEQLRNAKQL